MSAQEMAMVFEEASSKKCARARYSRDRTMRIHHQTALRRARRFAMGIVASIKVRMNKKRRGSINKILPDPSSAASFRSPSGIGMKFGSQGTNISTRAFSNSGVTMFSPIAVGPIKLSDDVMYLSRRIAVRVMLGCLSFSRILNGTRGEFYQSISTLFCVTEGPMAFI